jgi:hypothetical protein
MAIISHTTTLRRKDRTKQASGQNAGCSTWRSATVLSPVRYIHRLVNNILYMPIAWAWHMSRSMATNARRRPCFDATHSASFPGACMHSLIDLLLCVLIKSAPANRKLLRDQAATCLRKLTERRIMTASSRRCITVGTL